MEENRKLYLIIIMTINQQEQEQQQVLLLILLLLLLSFQRKEIWVKNLVIVYKHIPMTLEIRI